VFSAPAKYRVVKIARSSFEVVLQTTLSAYSKGMMWITLRFSGF
jgi:hypothetical protein